MESQGSLSKTTAKSDDKNAENQNQKKEQLPQKIYSQAELNTIKKSSVLADDSEQRINKFVTRLSKDAQQDLKYQFAQ